VALIVTQEWLSTKPEQISSEFGSAMALSISILILVLASHHIERMKGLAARGDGLNAYINEHVRKAYARKK